MAYSIVLADDHVLVRQGLKRILEGAEDLEVVGEADDGLKLLSLLRQVNPDMVILDISMPGMRGIEAIGEIRAVRPNAAILMLTMHRDIEYVHLALSTGAKGYLLKEDADKDLFSAIEKVRRGRTFVSPTLSEEYLDDLVQVRQGRPVESDPLTVRERQVVKLITEGKTSREIAGLLHISARTVENHRANIMEKLSLRKAADIVKYAIQKGYAAP
jgi:DNA-binding NarL/FixJ family response regulator